MKQYKYLIYKIASSLLLIGWIIATLGSANGITMVTASGVTWMVIGAIAAALNFIWNDWR